jgi:hypothetical protein
MERTPLLPEDDDPRKNPIPDARRKVTDKGNGLNVSG